MKHFQLAVSFINWLNVNQLPPNRTESTRLYAFRSLSSSIRGGGRVSSSIGGCVTGSTPQKSSVNAVNGRRTLKC